MSLFIPKAQAIELRPFQADMVQETRAKLRVHDAVLVQLPTGGGKTVLSSFMMQSAVAKGGRPWFVCHRDFLVDQTSKTLDRVGVEHAFIAAGRRWNPYAPAQVCGIDTLKSRLDRVPAECAPSVIFVDEGHHACSPTWARIINWAKTRGSKIIGLSATPERLDRKGLDELFGDIVRGPTLAWLIEQGFLSRYEAFAPSVPDLASLSTRAGDYKAEELEEEMNTDVLVGDMVAHYRRLAAGKRAVYFCVSIAHSQHVAGAFRAAGVTAVHLDGSDPSDVRRSAARSMAMGELDVICNVNLFGEGYDLAAQAGQDVTIECVGMARPTKSLAMYMQQVGRALRPKDSPAIILDHAGNLLTHGLPDDDREWQLAPRAKAKKRKPVDIEAAPIKVCPNCFATAAANKPACDFCGEPYPVKEGRMPEETEDQLQPVDKAALRAFRAQQEKECNSVEDLVKVGKARGYAKPVEWAAHLWTARNRRVEEQAAAQKRW